MSDARIGCQRYPDRCLALATAQSNIRALWDQLALIREYIEDIAPPGSVPNGQYAGDPEPATEAQMIIEGIAAAIKAAEGKWRPAPPIMIFTGEP